MVSTLNIPHSIGQVKNGPPHPFPNDIIPGPVTTFHLLFKYQSQIKTNVDLK